MSVLYEYKMAIPAKYDLKFLVISNNAVQLHTADEKLARRVAGALYLNGGNHAKVVNLDTLIVIFDTMDVTPVVYSLPITAR